MGDLERRVEKLENAATKRYQRIEDVLRIVYLKRTKNCTPEEQRELEELESMELEPKLHKTFLRLTEKRLAKLK